MRILFAEDCPTQRMILQTIMRKEGHDVVAVADGAEAAARALAETFDCVVTDWVMPGVDGLECVRRLRAIPRENPLHVIMVTAKGGRQDHVEALEAGVDDFIAKPVDADELRARLRTAERARRMIEEMRRTLAERYALRESLHSRERSYRDLFAKSPEPTAILAEDGRIAEVNDAWCVALGIPATSFDGRRWQDLSAPDAEAAGASFLATLERDGAVDDAVVRVVDGSGGVRELGASGVKLAGGGGMPVRYVLRAQDLTERRRRETEVRERERLASVGALLRGMAAEISDPLALARSNLGALTKYVARLMEHDRATETAAEAAVRGAADSAALAATARELGRKLKIDFIRADAAELLARTEECLERVRNLVSDVKNFTAGHEEKGETDLVAATRSALNLAGPKLKATAEIVLDLEETPPIRGNAARITQAILNILLNAAEAIPERGFVKATTRAEGDDAVLIVEDDGRGIAPEHMPRVFEPFYTTKPLGLGAGLGLNLAYNIVDAHDGRLSVESTPGRGTKVTFRFPGLPLEARAPKPPPPVAEPAERS